MLFSIIIFIATLLLLVLIHEFGHFIVAKKFGIKVLEFGFGIPPRVWGKKIGETLYSVNWLPFGGFVKLLGEDEDVSDKNSKDKKRNFQFKPVGQRIAVVVAGVVMNLILAWLLFYIVIIGQNFKIIYPAEPGVYIAEVEQGFPARQAGIRENEKLLAVNGQAISDIEQARNLIKAKGSVPVTLSLADVDGKNKREITVTPQKQDSGDVLIGVIFSPIPLREYRSIPEKLFSGITYSADLTRLTFAGFGKLGSDLVSGNFGQVSKSVAGPVGMATITNDILSGGWTAILPYIWFVGVISLTLSIFNVLPIPALDGGRLLFLVVEAATRKKVREDIERIVHQVGFIILLALILLITFSDIRKLFP
ncbi:hypothetical protein A3D83_03760 [Candidatus Daviesbacteria bacterium RIFCSPHIGHO2_02_FULL_41_10]|uniref:PDZ domain-containing protein n=1 Tax=Candidatus Daviesbacteria bacterium RIFCSPHIGHO2_02_FULL_41_10 TaxID=1797774 RepID=A0A1F5JXC6_9BACT|nr:MAG: hypothetical protein A3D83_03760 [Candidatus Daviesbacteria bacterium RIFCSPHIGHO2_02_FULL_41_10]